MKATTIKIRLLDGGDWACSVPSESGAFTRVGDSPMRALALALEAHRQHFQISAAQTETETAPS